MPTLLMVHHTPSPSCRAMFEAVRRGASNDEIEGVDVVSRAAPAATVPDVPDADGYLLGTPCRLVHRRELGAMVAASLTV